MIFTTITYILTAALGFMMAVLYKQTHSSAKFFNPDPRKALKLFIWFFVGSVLATYVLSWYSTYALQHAEIAEEGSIRFNNAKAVMFFIMNLAFILLNIFSIAYSQSLKKPAWVPFLFTLSFYIIFTMKDAYVISDYYLLWQKSVQFVQGEMPEMTTDAWTSNFFATLVVAFNAGVTWWSLRK